MTVVGVRLAHRLDQPVADVLGLGVGQIGMHRQGQHPPGQAIALGEALALGIGAEGAQSGYGLYTIAIDRRDEVQARLKAEGVPTAVYYSQPLPQMAAFRPYAEGQSFPESDRLAGRVLSLPMHPYLTDEQADYLCDRLIEAVG